MSAYEWLSIVTCAGHLALAILCVLRSARSPLAPPLALLCMVMFGWNFATLAYLLSGHPQWRYLDVSISPLTTPVALHFILTFVGQRRPLRWLLLLAYAALGGLSLLSASAFFSQWGREFAGSRTWALTHFVAIAPFLAVAVGLLIRHLRRQSGPEEQMRTRLVFVALFLGAVFASSELWADIGVPTPRLGNMASLTVSGLLALVALRFRLFDRQLPAPAAVYSLALAAVAVWAYLAVFYYFAVSIAVMVLLTITITFVLVAVTRQSVADIAAQRARTERLAVLGRLSAQMAHDLKNPLAALKGAAQFLQEERAQGRSIDRQEEFLTLIAEEIDRLSRLVEKYRRLGQLEPAFSQTPINELVRSVLRLRRLESDSAVELITELAKDIPECRIDADLVATALENLIRNALEAMPEGGQLVVRTELASGATGPHSVVITVSDTGSGMNARQIERAFDEFFTTKPSGSGLGLAFVRRVAEAHGGQVTISSQEGAGTQARLRLSLR